MKINSVLAKLLLAINIVMTIFLTVSFAFLLNDYIYFSYCNYFPLLFLIFSGLHFWGMKVNCHYQWMKWLFAGNVICSIAVFDMFRTPYLFGLFLIGIIFCQKYYVKSIKVAITSWACWLIIAVKQVKPTVMLLLIPVILVANKDYSTFLYEPFRTYGSESTSDYCIYYGDYDPHAENFMESDIYYVQDFIKLRGLGCYVKFEERFYEDNNHVFW